MLKSIFEAVIYLTALSLNKHRIHLIIVTVETQHSNLLAIAASPSPARLRPGLRRRISPQLHPSGCLCAKAPDSAWPAWPAFAPGSLHRPHPHPSHFSLSYANSCTNECTSLKIICQEQRHHLHSAGNCTGWTRPAAAGAREGPWVGATWASVAQRTLVKSRELALYLTRSGKAEGQGWILGRERSKFFLFLGDFVPSQGGGKGSFCLTVDPSSCLSMFLDFSLESPSSMACGTPPVFGNSSVLDVKAEEQRLQQQPGRRYHRVILDEALIHWVPCRTWFLSWGSGA